VSWTCWRRRRSDPHALRAVRELIGRFDHPYAAVAGRPGSAGSFAGLPLFSAWVHEPREVGETTVT
jgi:hypothetical protein